MQLMQQGNSLKKTNLWQSLASKLDPKANNKQKELKESFKR